MCVPDLVIEHKRHVEYAHELQVRLVRVRSFLNMQRSAVSVAMAGLRRPPTRPSLLYGTEDQILG